MFGRANVFGMINGFGVRVKDAREKDKNHLIEAKFEVPLTHELADEILPAMAADLFDRVAGDWVPKPEVDEVAFNLTPDTQILELREHPDLPAIVRIMGVSIRRVAAYKGEANALFLGFTTTWTLGDEREPIAIIKRLKTGVYLTCEAQQPNLAEQAGPQAADPVPQPAQSSGDAGQADDSGIEGDAGQGEGGAGDGATLEAAADDTAGNREGAAGDVAPRNRRNRRGLRGVTGGAAAPVH